MSLLLSSEISDNELTFDSETVFLFDLDGTLVNTDEANFKSYHQAFINVTNSNPEFIFEPNGRFNRSLLKASVPTLTIELYEQIIFEKERIYNDYLSDTSLNSPVVSVLYEFEKSHQTVLVSNCREQRGLAILNFHGLTSLFNQKFFRQIEPGKKVNKYQFAINQLSICPSKIVAFENESEEIADALESGIRFINPIIKNKYGRV